MDGHTLASVHNLRMRYGRTEALRGVSLSIYRGEMIGLLGANGCGKTTLMKILAGLLQTYQGSVSVCGETDTWKTKNAVCFYPANPFCHGNLSLEKTMELYSSLYPGYQRDQAAGLFREFCFDASARLGQLSKGKRALALFILNLCRKGQLYILDEPFGGIDIRTREMMKQALLRLITPEKTFLISTHELTDMESLFERIILMKQGLVALDGCCDDLREERGCSITEIVKEEL